MVGVTCCHQVGDSQVHNVNIAVRCWSHTALCQVFQALSGLVIVSSPVAASTTRASWRPVFGPPPTKKKLTPPNIIPFIYYMEIMIFNRVLPPKCTRPPLQKKRKPCTTICQRAAPLCVREHHYVSGSTTVSASTTMCQRAPLCASEHHYVSASTTMCQRAPLCANLTSTAIFSPCNVYFFSRLKSSLKGITTNSKNRLVKTH